MDPTPGTPFSDVGPAWSLTVFCRCRIVDFIHAYRERHYPRDMTEARLCARLRCPKCGERPREAYWEATHVGRGGLPQDARRVRVV